MALPQITASEAIAIARSISIARLCQAYLHRLIDLGDRSTQEERLDLYQTTGSSPPSGPCERDLNLAQYLRAYRVSEVRVHRWEVA